MPNQRRTCPPLATGTVTFLFTDIEGSTALWEQDAPRMSQALAAHDALVRNAVESHCGTVVKMTGDGMHAVFEDAPCALAATLELQQAIADLATTCGVPLCVRCGLHVGMVERRDNDYFGSTVNRAARIMDAAHGGQVLLSQAIVSLVGDHLPEGVGLRDLGSVRLRDLERPEHVYQLMHPQLRQDFPALRSLEATPNNLPQQATSFVGRERELAEVKKLLLETRLLTLVGVGGLGKTRLALQVGVNVLDDYPDGVWFVGLAPLPEARLVPQVVASVLGIKETVGNPLIESLTEYVKDRQLLLILDNCEHLGHACAELVKRLLQAGAQLKVLASSRERLHVAGETTYPLAPLSAPSPQAAVTIEALAQCDAVRLFIDRAIAAQPTFRVTGQNASAVADICRHLDGIPLALELAAARVNALSVRNIAVLLSDRFHLLAGGDPTEAPRQQAMRTCLDWSYGLLTELEQVLFRRLSVFAGWTLEAAKAVSAGGEITQADVLDLLTHLVDKSLVGLEGEGERYRMLETMREYARDRLSETGEKAQWENRHLAYFLALAEEAEPHLTGGEQGPWLERLETEHNNVRSALAWSSAAGGDAACGLQLAGALWRFWHVRGYLGEGRSWLSRLLAAAPGAGAVIRANAFHGASALARRQGDYSAARTLGEESLEIRRKLGDQRGIAKSSGTLGNVAHDLGDYVTARTLHEESLAIKRELGDRWGIATSLNNLGAVAHSQGDYTAARALDEESLAISRELGDRQGISFSLNNLGTLAFNEGNNVDARAFYEESLTIRRELGDPWSIANILDNLARVDNAEGDYTTARARLEESVAILWQLGDRASIVWPLEGLACISLNLSKADRAARLWGRAERLREEVKRPLHPSERLRYDQQVAATRMALGDEAAFDQAWQEGRAMTLEHAIEYALEAQRESPTP